MRFLAILALVLPLQALEVSKEADELCKYYETGSSNKDHSYYDKFLQRPTVPPAPSGVTIGVGYDLGYNTAAQIAADWKGLLPDAQIKRLQSVAGKKGALAKAALPSVRDIYVPWDKAIIVYDRKTTPRFVKLTEAAYPGVTKLHPHIQGVMLSTSFNRGTAFAGDRRRELRWTRDDIGKGKIKDLPAYQLAMRRLWPTIPGLQKRYTAHAGLMQRGVELPR